MSRDGFSVSWLYRLSFPVLPAACAGRAATPDYLIAVTIRYVFRTAGFRGSLGV